jgi:hypothetical protein
VCKGRHFRNFAFDPARVAEACFAMVAFLQAAMISSSKLYPDCSRLLPNTERLTLRGVSLCTGAAIGEKKIAMICQSFRFRVIPWTEISRPLIPEGGHLSGDKC